MGAFSAPRPKIVAVAPPVAIPVSVSGSGTVQLQPRADFTSHYDPSRVVNLDRLNVVADMRAQGSERGESQTGDNGELGPGSSNGIFVPNSATADSAPETGEKNKVIPLALLAAAVLIFGG